MAQSCPTLCNPMDYRVRGQDTGVGSLSLLQGIFPTQGSNPGLPHCKLILYQLSHQQSPRIMVWVAFPFSSRSSQPRNRTRISYIAGGFFTSCATREAQRLSIIMFSTNFFKKLNQLPSNDKPHNLISRKVLTRF